MGLKDICVVSFLGIIAVESLESLAMGSEYTIILFEGAFRFMKVLCILGGVVFWDGSHDE